MNDSLTDAERAILEFERLRWNHVGLKEDAIRERFGISPTRFYQRLNAVIDKPAAVAEHPVLVRRLRRLRATRAARRSGSTQPVRS